MVGEPHCYAWLCRCCHWRQQTTKLTRTLIAKGQPPLAAAHGDKPNMGAKFISASGNEVFPYLTCTQTSFGGVYAATAPATTASSVRAPTIDGPHIVPN